MEHKAKVISVSAQKGGVGNEITITGTYEKTHNTRPPYSYTKIAIQKKIAWDHMFLLWAPRLLTTLSATNAKQELERGLKDYMGEYTTINENPFNKIKIQYLALGLIDVYEARTTSRGTAEFIKLSASGKSYLVQKSAVKK